MPKVEFHILSSAGDDARRRHACQLVDQACQQNKPVFVRVESDADAQNLDELLWTFRDQAFIPHEVMTPQSPSHPRIMALIGLNESVPASFQSLLINLSNDIPVQIDDALQVIEVVDADPEHKRQARERYKAYRERGFTLETINH
jgi:DNA polymerase-3 subunit chi